MDRKMAAAGDLERLGPADMSLPGPEQIEESARQFQALQDRRDLLRQEIIKAYLSARRELPADDVLDMEVTLALGELKEIPSRFLAEAFQEAKVTAGAFLVTNGTVLKAWREKRKGAEGDAQAAIRRRNDETLQVGYQRYESDKPRKEFLQEFFSEIRAKLGGV